MAAWAMSISEPLAARRPRARAARSERRLGRHVDEVEHGRRRRQPLDVDGHPRVDHADRRRVDGQVGRLERGREGRVLEPVAAIVPVPTAANRPASAAAADRVRLPIVTPARTGVQAGEDDRVRRAAGPGDDDVQRPSSGRPMRQLDARPGSPARRC